MSRPSINQLLSELSSEALSYFFPGYVRKREAEPSKPSITENPVDYDSGIRFRMTEVEPEDDGIRFSVTRKADYSIEDLDLKDLKKPKAYSRVERSYKPKPALKEKTEAKPRKEKAPKEPFSLRKSVSSAMEPKIKNLALDERTQSLLAELKALQDKYGVTIDELEAVLTYQVKLSRLRVTARREVILEDFDRREVRMDTLTKAVFLLYLKHPEGISYKDLIDHRTELEDIYMSITGRGELDAIRKSIDDLVSPLVSNSINEKVSKVKKAFRDVVDERVARFYYIDGDKGTAKSIALDRSNVIWE